MGTNDRLPPQAEPPGRPALPHAAGPYPLGNLGYVNGKSPPPAHFAAEAPPPGDLSVWWHALRRRWLPGLVAGVLLAGVLGTVAWLLQPSKFTALSLLRVASSEQQLVFRAEPNGSPLEVYRATQQELLTSPFVIAAALRKSEVARLPVIRAKKDPAGWLSQALRVKAPKETEILEVSLTTSDPAQSATLVNAVVDAYLTEVVDVEQKRRSVKLNELDRAFTEKETEVRKKWNDLKQLTEQLGTGDTEALSVKQQVQIQRYGELQRQQSLLQVEQGRVLSELKMQQAIVDSNGREGPSEEEVTMAQMQDPMYNRLLGEWLEIEKLTALRAGLGVVSAARQSDGHTALLRSATQARLDARREEIRREVRDRRLVLARSEIQKRQVQLSVLKEQETVLGGKIEELQKLTDQIGRRSTDAEMMRADIKQFQDVLSNIGREREQLKVEMRSSTRVARLQLAEPPEFPDLLVKALITAFAALMGLAGPGAALVWLDVCGRRINASQEVARDVGLRILGAVPVVPARALQRITSGALDGDDGRYGRWRTIVAESVDGIVARLLRLGGDKPSRVLLISSAVGGEGKTTLATQLAINLARTGRRTALVDFDLRRPAIHRMLDLPRHPGVSEYLRGLCSLEELAQPTLNPGLSAIVAGRWDPQSIMALTSERVETLFAWLREEFQYVIVDGCPILPMADTRFLTVHVDGVILTVLRDVSRAPNVRATCEILAGLGAHVLGAVVADQTNPSYYRDPRYDVATAASSSRREAGVPPA